MVYSPTGRSDLILILGCMNSNLLILELISTPPRLIGLEIYKPPGEHTRGFIVYSGTPPHGHLGNMVTSSLRPLFFLAAQPDIIFLVKKPLLIRSPLNTASFFWPIGDQIPEVPRYIINIIKGMSG